ncbi:alpha/beta fold hydrolase [Lawsonella clevelandensis]|uniref:AB hydrolase-1 domain-containing protein n=1 Tax=Lawsonella clevelandensis TaxID=1528099 RepID=A0A0M4LYB8_9ACTN|nr:alpha/beta hydrolase [Lawsonella clevelandensis]ALE18482.1 hypothetical protein AL705_00675 [Lawsonella clevelandensis]ALE34134.1 hypothetical protein IY73_00690 [Lawsonella clevelandensis]MDU7193593.1 alpha/beta hydrolase [Lawsonella clevelandensis]VHN99664.1 hypothetical protein LC603019_00141 [Lawsonella clevelandensis]
MVGPLLTPLALPRLQPPLCVIALPGTGFDAHFSQLAFSLLAEELSARLVAVDPQPGHLLEGFLSDVNDVLAEATQAGERVIIAGVSIGAIAACRIALQESHRENSHAVVPSPLAAVVALMAPWTGDGFHTAPAALSAGATAAALDELGIAEVRAAMVASSPQWLSALQDPCWERYGDELAALMREVSVTPSLTSKEFTRITTPVGVVSVDDDPLHPATVGQEWAAALQNSATTHLCLSDIEKDVAVFSRASLSLLFELFS